MRLPMTDAEMAWTWVAAVIVGALIGMVAAAIGG